MNMIFSVFKGEPAMKSLATLAVTALFGVCLLAAEDKEQKMRLSKDDIGKVPAGWKAGQTGKGEGSVWKVVADDTAPSKSGLALAQTAESPSALFNLCVSDEPSIRDVEVMVSFKAVQGKKD